MRYLKVLSLIVSASEMLLLHFDSKNSITLHGKNISDNWESWGPPEPWDPQTMTLQDLTSVLKMTSEY